MIRAPRHRLLVALGLAVSVVAGLAWWIVSELPDLPPAGADLAWQSVPVALTPVDSATEDDRIGELIYRAGYELKSMHPAFGGFSGLLVEASESGPRLVAVADKGWWWRAEMRLDDDGTFVGLEGSEMAPIADFGRVPVLGRMRNDAEELARGTEGRLLVAFEGGHRIHAYESPGHPDPRRHPSPAAVAGAGRNEGMEAVTRLADGRLFVVAEDFRDEAGLGRAWIARDRGWSERSLVLVDDYLPTAATTLPSGDVLLLTRYYHPAVGVRARLGRIARKQLAPDAGDPIEAEELARFEPPVPVDNFEALDVLEADDRLFVFVLSDDNFRTSQRTLLLQLELVGSGRL